MCTAISYFGNRHYFGRNLDVEAHHEEQVVTTPRNFPLPFRKLPPLNRHHAIIGIATVAEGYPLYYDAVNEYGLAMAGLSFPHSAHYFPYRQGADNVTPFELIPWVLGQCANVGEAEILLSRISLLDESFSPLFPISPLHWMLADAQRSLVVESTVEGLRVWQNPTHVLTNEPPFPLHLFRLNDFLSLSDRPPENTFDPALGLKAYSRGMGALGLPGDLSSPSRFVRAAFAAHNSIGPSDVTRFFRMMACVEVPGGCVRLEDGTEVLSVYTSCCDLNNGRYHYATCTNRQISAVDLHEHELDSDTLTCHPLITDPQIRMQS
jgi:choloylglycine hydrolase